MTICGAERDSWGRTGKMNANRNFRKKKKHFESCGVTWEESPLTRHPDRNIDMTIDLDDDIEG